MAKHANPRISMLSGLCIEPDQLHHGYGPDASAFGTYLSAEAMYYAIGFGMSGICVALAHCSDQALQSQLRAEALRVLQARHGLESWLSEWRKAAEHESAHGVVQPGTSAALASELLAEAARLEQETAQLKRETEQLDQQTRRLGRRNHKDWAH